MAIPGHELTRLLMVTNTWDNDYTAMFIEGIKERIANEKIIVHVFNIYDEYQKSAAFYKQTELFDLPNIEWYDGLILAVSSGDILPELEDLIDRYIHSGKPIITSDQEFDGAQFCGIDNYKSMYKMVEHMIVEHGASVLNYIGGRVDYLEEKERTAAFEDCLKAHGIEIDERRIRHYNFLEEDGVTAYRDFEDIGLNDADTVICSNDHMAVGYCTEAEKNGVSVPEEVRVTGFDNIEKGRNFFPSITSVDRNRKQSGYDCADALLRMIVNGKDNITVEHTTGYVVERESCGCVSGQRNLRKEYSNLLLKNKAANEMVVGQNVARQKMSTCVNFDQFQATIGDICKILNIPEFVVCLNESFFDSDYNDETTGFSNHINFYTKNMRGVLDRDRDGLMPEEFLVNIKCGIAIISALQFREKTHGYLAMEIDLPFFESGNHRTFVESVALAMENLSQRITLDGMNRQLQKLYVRDSLTGLYNRFGYAALSNGFFEKALGRVYLEYVDLDNLKHINDCYGHGMGDIAIKCAANALLKAFDDTDIIVRMGGDEFLIMGRLVSEADIERRERNAAKLLEKLGRENNLPVTLEGSMGHAINESFETNMSLESLVTRADKNMYEIKQVRKASKNSVR